MKNSGVSWCRSFTASLPTLDSDLSTNSPCHLSSCAQDITFCQAVSSNDVFQLFPDNLLYISGFSVDTGLNLNMSKWFECLFSRCRSACPPGTSIVGWERPISVDYVKYLEFIVDKNLKRPSQTSISNGCWFKSEGSETIWWDKVPSTAFYINVFRILPYCFAASFLGLCQK